MIIDAFTFFNELDMLEFRMPLLYDLVDKFVIVESNRTFSGEKKPFYFEENKDDFAWAQDKIVNFHVFAPEIKYEKPASYDPTNGCWLIEYNQRNSIIDACKDFSDEDILLMGDVDEIPTRESLEWIRKANIVRPSSLTQHFFYYNLTNLRREVWKGTIVSSLGEARSTGTQNLRNQRNRLATINPGGWHLSYFGDIRTKIESFSHQEYNTPEFKDERHIAQCRKTGKDLFNRRVIQTKVGKDFFPEYFVSLAPEKWWQP